MATGEIVDRETMCGAHYTDYEVAGKVRGLMRNDLDHEMVITIARDRIMWQSQEIERLQMQLRSAGVDIPGDELPPTELWELLDKEYYIFQKDMNTIYFVIPRPANKENKTGAEVLVLKREILFKRWNLLDTNDDGLMGVDFAELDGCYLLGKSTTCDEIAELDLLKLHPWIITAAIDWEAFGDIPYSTHDFIDGFWAQYREVDTRDFSEADKEETANAN